MTGSTTLEKMVQRGEGVVGSGLGLGLSEGCSTDPGLVRDDVVLGSVSGMSLRSDVLTVLERIEIELFVTLERLRTLRARTKRPSNQGYQLLLVRRGGSRASRARQDRSRDASDQTRDQNGHLAHDDEGQTFCDPGAQTTTIWRSWRIRWAFGWTEKWTVWRTWLKPSLFGGLKWFWRFWAGGSWADQTRLAHTENSPWMRGIGLRGL